MEPHPEREAELEALCAVVLAGGRSRRMGVNKARIRIRGTTLVERALCEARQVTPLVLLSTDDPHLVPGVPFVTDRYPGQGPLAGLHATMRASSSALFLLLACDLPNVTAPLLRALVWRAPGFDAVVPCTSDGLPHPTCAVYRRSCLPRIEANLEKGDNRMMNLLRDAELRIRWLRPSEGTHTDFDLANANTPADLDPATGTNPGNPGPGGSRS